jgi:hypothetical protein
MSRLNSQSGLWHQTSVINQAFHLLTQKNRLRHRWLLFVAISVVAIACSNSDAAATLAPESAATPGLPTAVPTSTPSTPPPTPTPPPTESAPTPEPAPLPVAFESIGHLDSAREEHSTTLLNDGRVLIIGGRNQFGSVISATLVFDPPTDSLETVGELNEARAGHSATTMAECWWPVDPTI